MYILADSSKATFLPFLKFVVIPYFISRFQFTSVNIVHFVNFDHNFVFASDFPVVELVRTDWSYQLLSRNKAVLYCFGS